MDNVLAVIILIFALFAVGFVLATITNGQDYDLATIIAANQMFYQDPNSVEYKITAIRQQMLQLDNQKEQLLIKYDYNNDSHIDLNDFAIFAVQGYQADMLIDSQLKSLESQLKAITEKPVKPQPVAKVYPIHWPNDINDINSPKFQEVFSTVDTNGYR